MRIVQTFPTFVVLGVLAMSAPGAHAAAAMTAADCSAKWDQLDIDHKGTVSMAQAPEFYGYYKTANKALDDGMLTKDKFATDCAAGMYTTASADPAATDPAAPLEGANSFTQGQAKDRITAKGGTAVSDLTKDEKGIWRGTATVDGGQQNVAVDFKGNVVFSK